jgi:diguanylate cyclase (GGDEF)-like protein/PAS domain S-box-containing protein
LIIKGSNGQPDRSLNYMVDGTDAHLARARIVEAQARLSALVEHNVDAIIVQDVIGGPLVYASPGFSKILGISSADSIGSSLQDWIHPDDVTRANERMAHLAAGLGTLVTFDCRLRRSDGSWRHVEVTGTNLIDNPAVRGVVNNLHDVTDRVEAASRLAHQAMHDTLTGLPNRTLFLDRLDQALARAARSARPCALLFVDLDRFKHINDTLGHAAGDQLLMTVAERLHQAVRPGDSVARLGGDEFVVLAENVDPATALTIAHRVRAIIAQPVALSHRAVLVTCSVGIALSDRYAPEALLQEADMAVYRSKAMGGNRLEVYDHAMRAQAHRRLELEDLVRSAVSGAENLLAMHYQPIVELATGTVVGTEALARISEPGGSIVGPNDFIPVAEESGLILPLGLAVLDLACAQQARWQATNAQQTHVAINVSGRQLSGSQFVRSVADALAVYHLQPDNLCIELTESTLIDAGSSTQTHLEDLKKIGVTLAMDDFGTGWSSLSYLRQFPIDVVKIDQSFVAGLGTDDENTELVRAVIGLGRALDITTVAEGVETETQDRLLCEMGCDRGQGFLYGRPQPAE